jgi:16S rRNA (adenine1518-N6/adenine1519-N6)-dimethyltransferase
MAQHNRTVAHGIPLKKQYGQHFLRDQAVVDQMLNHVMLTPQTSVFEIGSGDGFLTRSILATPIKQLWVFEIDPAWANYVRTQYPDPRMTVFEDNFLDIDFARLEPHKPWTLLANLPYQITFPILYLLQKHRALLDEGVIMVQEEVAQKIIRQRGRGYGAASLLLQYYFQWQLLAQVPPTAFYPPPKVYSRLIYFKPKRDVQPIPDEEEFWKFVKACFRQPRRTLKNNFAQTHYPIGILSEDLLHLRAQELGIGDFLNLWDLLRTSSLG